MRTVPYDRAAAVAYARRWALSRNPRYLDFSPYGGDCTNFASQCLFAGARQMHRADWYYENPRKRAPAWSGVRFLREFLLGNEGAGPNASEVDPENAQPGDIIILNNGARYYHALVVLAAPDGAPVVAAHTIDSVDRPLSTYYYDFARCLQVLTVRQTRV